MVLEMKIIKKELRFEENLKKRLEFICEFSKVTPTFVNGSIRKIEKTNISYIEPHRVIVKDTTFLVFNYSNDVYISNLAKKDKIIKLIIFIVVALVLLIGGYFTEDTITDANGINVKDINSAFSVHFIPSDRKKDRSPFA
mgnify:CR=1 FL=1